MRVTLLLALLPVVLTIDCPSNSQEFNGYCYQVISSFPSNYDTADQYCSNRGMANSHLASVMNSFENSYLRGLIPTGIQAFIGGKLSSNQSYAWADGLPFAYDNIDYTSNNGNCLVLDQASGKWLRVSCSAGYAFICKITETAPFQISNSTGFKAAADYLLRGMDPTASPCEDFYQFTCGTYLKNVSYGNGIYYESQTEVNRETAVALDSVTNSSSLTERITKQAYDACVYNYYQEQVADKSQIVYQEILNAFGISELPLFMNNPDMFSIPSTQIMRAAGYFEGSHAMGTLMFSWTTVDYKNVSENALFIDQPGLPLPRDYYVKPQFLTILESHVQEYAQLLALWAADLQKPADMNTLQKVAADVVNFEVAIALASWPDEEQRNFKQMYNPYNLNALSIAYPNIEWQAYLNNLLKNAGLTSNIFTSEEVIISQPSYFAWLNSLFAGHQFSSATIVNYMTVQALYDSADFLGQGYDALAEKNGRLPYLMQHEIGISRRGNRERRKFDSVGDMCLDIIMAYMPYGPGYVYVKQIGDSTRQATIADVAIQTDNIISSFKDMIGTLDWMTSGSKNNAYTKAANLIKNIGWPAMFKDFVDTTTLDAYHQDYAQILNLDKTQYYQIQLVLKAGMETRESLRLLNQPADRTNFLQSPAMVNAWYQPERNSITFPFAAFNAPYYNLQYPQAFNYGGQGGTGGHELTHGYDDEGVQFGPDGSLKNCDNFHCGWMDMNSTAGFIDMAQCVVTQYSTQCCPVKTGNVHCANGATTQGENIADLGGQQAAYRAYRKYIATARNGIEEARLPGLQEYSPNQIFWISYGFSWCIKQSQASLVRQLLTNPHAPASCRTNNVMQDIPEFGIDFSCPKGSTLYPQDANRCKVWVGK